MKAPPAREESRLRKQSILMAIAAVLFALLYFYETTQIRVLSIGDPIGARGYPFVLAAAIVVAAALLFLDRPPPPLVAETEAEPAAPAEGLGAWIVTPLLAVWMAAYFVAFEPIGYLIATTVFLAVIIAAFTRAIVVSTGVAVLFSLGSYELFTWLFMVPLPRGILGN